MNINLQENPFYLNEKQIAWVNSTLAGMSDDDKIRHLFCLVAYDDDEEACRYMAEKIRPGGFMSRIMTAEKCISTVKKMQSYSKIPLLVAANLEAGGNGMAKEGTLLGRPMQIAATNDVENARRLGEVCGVEGSAVGANWAFAPIVDIDYNWRSSITNIRTFGRDPERVRAFGTAYVKEIQKHGVAGCFKHFPGDGCDERDQHVAISINSLSCEEWDNTYGMIYKAGIDAGVKTMMIGHILQPAYTKHFAPDTKDSEMLPASMNRALVTDLLRKKLGFNGLVVTDSTAMAGLAALMPREMIVPMTIAAGCDMFLFTKNLEEDLEFMRRGYENGVFDKNRLDEAVTRILALKASLGLPEKRENGTLIPKLEDAQKVLGQEKFKAWGRECSDRAITLVKKEEGILPFTPKRFPRILFCPLYNLGRPLKFDESNPLYRFYTMLGEAGFDVTVFQSKKALEGAMPSVDEMRSKYDAIVYAVTKRANYQVTTRVAWEEPLAANLPTLCHTIPTMFISFEYPYYLFDVPHVRTYINCYADNRLTMQPLMDKLLGKSEFVGVSPVDAFCGKWETHVAFGPSLHLEDIK